MAENPTYEELGQRVKQLEQEADKRKQAEEALSESNKIINRSPAVAFLWENKEGWPVEFVTENVEKLFGYGAREFIDRKISYAQIIHRDDLERVAGEVAGYSKTVELQKFTHKPYRIITKNGDVKWVNDTTFIRRDPRGIITHYEGIVYDITDRKQAEIKLKESEEKFSKAFYNHPTAMQITDLKTGERVDVNESCVRLFGFQKEEIQKGDMDVNSGWVDPEAQQNIVEKLLRNRFVNNYPVDIINKSGEIRNLLGSGAMLDIGDGNLAIESFIDITERKRTEEVLEEQKDFLNTLLETIASPVFYKDAHGRYTGCNRAFEEFTGKSRGDIIGKTVYDLGPKEIADKYYEKDSELFNNPGKQRYEWKVKNADGMLRDVIFNKATLKDADGNVAGLVGIISDISDLKRSEQDLREREETLKAILAASPIGICLARNRILEWANQTMYRICGYEADSLLGRSVRILYSDIEEYERVGRDFYIAVEHNGVGKIETQWVTKNGEKIYCYLQGCQLDPSDPSKGIIVAATDITERKQSEDLVRNLSQMLIKAQENERQMISYELHDSIAQSLSSLKIDCDTFFDNHTAISPELMKKMVKQSKLIGQVIRAVRDLSYGLHPPSLDQIGIIQALSQLCEDFAEETGLFVEFTPTGMGGLRPDQMLGINLYRLVQEGLNNVRKHADAARVTVSLVASHPNVILRIEDDGKGFDVKAREAALDRKKKLGLRSMTERVDLLQGKMKIKSTLKKGTKILIKIPFKKDKENGGS